MVGRSPYMNSHSKIPGLIIGDLGTSVPADAANSSGAVHYLLHLAAVSLLVTCTDLRADGDCEESRDTRTNFAGGGTPISTLAAGGDGRH